MPNSPLVDRRTLLGGSLAAVGGLSLSACAGTAAASAAPAPTPPPIPRGSVVLFQGDSITDADRDRKHAAEPNSQPGLGKGYAWLAAAGLLARHRGEELRVFNRGVSGNKVYQLAERWQADCLDLKPDVLSVLIGVNDIWHTKGGGYKGTVAIYERDYDALLARTRITLPKVKFVVCEPFVLRCGAVEASWFPEFDEYRAAALRVAQKHGAAFVPFQAMFDEAARLAPPQRWAEDGVHPSADGAALMAQAWLDVVHGAVRSS